MKKVGTDATVEELKKAKSEIMGEYKKAYEEVKALGGLYIIGSERHESRRIDNQLRGRSGRQGDPGTSQFYISLDDPLMRLFARDGMKEMLGRMGLNTGEAIHHKMLDSAIENAQKKVEERNFAIRKRLLEYDDVLNEERNFIYAQRDEILLSSDLTNRVEENNKELIEEIYEDANGDEKRILEGLNSLYSTSFLPDDVKNKDEFEKKINSLIEAKKNYVGEEIFNDYLRYIYLKNIDKRWIDHLDQLEELRDAASLMSYAQKNPLVEYKNTASDAFDDMIGEITKAVCKAAVLVRFQINGPKKEEREKSLQAVHKTMGQIDQARERQTAVSSQSQAQNTTIKRTSPKVGRNDPCPCGSGKKYKNCCGRQF